MKILINGTLPFALAHGGEQIQIERTQAALQSIGLEVEPVRWWDEKQTGDIIHFVGQMPTVQIELAHQNGIKVVMAKLLTSPGSRTPAQLWLQRILRRILARIVPKDFVTAFHWKSYQLADACIALTSWEARLMTYLFDTPPERVHVVPNGVEEVFLQAPPVERGPWLVCTATITERKRVLELAEAAALAQTPVWILGKAYAEADPYAQRFYALARRHPKTVRFEGPISDRAKLAQVYRAARGFVLLSTMESLSLSALEAAACECPLLLSDLPWARSTFGEHARYCPVSSPQRTAGHLRAFYDQAPSLKPPPKPATWTEVAHQFKTIYERLLSTSR
jgi:glycosyltransferase involved in cell wall biosynthesis